MTETPMTNGLSIDFDPIETTAAKELTDVARRYCPSDADMENGEDKRPVVNLPAGTVLQITGIWDGGYLAAVSGDYGFPVSYNEVPEGLYDRLWAEHGPKTLRCPNCDGGWRYDTDEGGRPVQDACYTCGNSGRITEDEYFVIRMRLLADFIGTEAVQRRKRAADSNPDGEGWAFHAAENMMHEYEYTQAVMMEESAKAGRLLGKLMEEGHRGFVEVIVNEIIKPDEKLYEKPEPKPKKAKASPPPPPPVTDPSPEWKPPPGYTEADIPF
jgi:hypothetical protein